MLDDLLVEISNAPDPEDDNWVRIKGAGWRGADLVLDVRIIGEWNRRSRSRWSLRCVGLIDFDIGDVDGGGLDRLAGDHPVVKQFSDPNMMLHFRGIPEDVGRTIGDLWQAHTSVADGWIEFDRYLNRNLPLGEMLAGGYGLIAEGPRFLLEEYRRPLEREGCETSYICAPGVLATPPQIEGIQFGNSYVVAKGFEARRRSRGR